MAEKKGFLDSKLAQRGRPRGEQKETPEHLAKKELISENEYGVRREDKLRYLEDKYGVRTIKLAIPCHELVEIHRGRQGYKTKNTTISDIVLKAVQDYYFNNDTLEALERIRDEQDLRTVGEAIDFVTQKYENSVN